MTMRDLPYIQVCAGMRIETVVATINRWVTDVNMILEEDRNA